jgi:hypothetical protein
MSLGDADAQHVFKPKTEKQQSAATKKLENLTQAKLELLVQGVASGYKIARGRHTQVAASDTVITGLATVVAVVASFDSAPTVKQLFCAAQIGDQAGSPAAGSILIKTFKPTAVNDVTPIAATDFTENLVISWVAIGT